MNKQEIVQRLQHFQDEADRALKLFDSTGKRVPMPKVPEVRECVRNLQVKLRAEYKRMDGSKNRENLSRLESAFYQPAITDALHNGPMSGIHANTLPNGKWYSALSDVSYYMGHWNGELKDVPEN